jgi:hypothetical protein
MSDGYGKKIGQAIRAVQQMHSDSSRLLLDLDRIMHGWECLYGAYVANDIPSTVARGRFMAEGLYRHYSLPQHPTRVVALNLCFFDATKPSLLAEPLLVAAELNYELQGPMKSAGREWDPWTAFFGWIDRPNDGELITLESPECFPRKLSARLLASPLYDVKGSDHLRELIAKVCSIPLPGS